MKKLIRSTLITIIFILGMYYIGLGFLPRSDVIISDFEVSDEQDKMTIYVTIGSSAGYTRKFKNVSKDPKKMKLKFYSAFGGVNGSIGAKHEFDIPLSEECEEIYVLLNADYKLNLIKDESTGEWKLV